MKAFFITTLTLFKMGLIRAAQGKGRGPPYVTSNTHPTTMKLGNYASFKENAKT